jgi:threonine dehydrogenase-like Zn-dependent dehydrogenase
MVVAFSKDDRKVSERGDQAVKAITVKPGTSNSLRLEEYADPVADSTHLLVETIALGICGTDRDIIMGHYGWAPPGASRLVIGHESLGRVLAAPEGSGFTTGDLVVGIVRRPDPVPCPACGAGEWDMCRNGLYTERGIKAVDGYGAQRFLLEPAYAVKVAPSLGALGVLLEPASVLAKAWDHIDRIGRRTASWKPRTVLITGAGPVGLLAALMAHQRGLQTHVLDRADRPIKTELVRALGGIYHADKLPPDLQVDIVIECTASTPLILDALCRSGGNGIVCLTGVSTSGHTVPFDAGAFNRTVVLQNDVVFGSVNANRRHYEMGAEALAAADPVWLARLITRRVPLARWPEAFERHDGDIKVVLQFAPDPT